MPSQVRSWLCRCGERFDCLHDIIHHALTSQCFPGLNSKYQEQQQHKENNKKIVHMVRHGQSLFNLAKKTYSKLQDPLLFDCSLTDLGITQAREVGKLLLQMNSQIGIPIELCVTSPLTRAIQTCEYALESYSASTPPLHVVVNPLCTEMVTDSCDLGSCCSTIQKQHPSFDFSLLPEFWSYKAQEIVSRQISTENKTQEMVWKEFEMNPFVEPFNECAERVVNFIQWIKSRPEKRIAVFAHGDFLHAATGAVLGNAEMVTLNL